MFGFSSDAPDTDRSEILRETRGDINTLAHAIDERRFSYDDRQTIATALADVFLTGHRLTDDATSFPWVPPEKDPSTDELVIALDGFRDSLTAANLTSDVPTSTLTELRSQLREIRDAVERTEPFPYAFKEESVEEEHGKPVRSIGVPADSSEDKPEVFAGPRARKQIEGVPREHPDSAPLFVGTGTKKGRDATIPRSSLFEHSCVFGLTGTGKSTHMTNAMKQVVEWGYGACYIDPKGDDSKRLMKILPDDRLDDVIWIEPSSTREYVSGFNFINVGLPPDHDLYPIALTNLIEDLVKLLGAGEYWGPRMDRVARNLIRAMNEYNRLSGDAEPDLNLVDLYYVLASEASREEFAARVKAVGMHFIEDYTQKVAQMDDSDLEPLLGRFQPWVQDGIVRRMIGFRDGGVNIPKAIRDGKIIIVRMGAENKPLKRMLGMAVIRRMWAQIRARSQQAEREREPYYLFCDEFDNLAIADETIPTMLSESRSYRLSITMGNQYPGQLPENVVDGMTTNCKSVLSFNPGDKKQADRYKTQLGLDAETLTSEADYHLWMRVDDDEEYERSDAFRVYTNPPFPPYRTDAEVEELIRERLRKYGRRQQSPWKQKQELLFHRGNGRLETGFGREIVEAKMQDVEPEYIASLRRDLQTAVRQDLPEHMVDASTIEADEQPSGAVDMDPETDTSPASVSAGSDAEGFAEQFDDTSDTPVRPGDSPGLKGETADGDSDHATDDTPADSPFTASQRDTVLESIFAARIQADVQRGAFEPGRWVPIEDAKRELKRRLDDDVALGTSLSEIAQAYEVISDRYAHTAQRSGEPQARLTDYGRAILFQQDTGSSGSGGSMKHRLVLRAVYTAFTTLGYITSLPTQGGDELPDGLAESPINPAKEATMDAIEQARDELQEAYPAVWALSQGQDVSIEAETSTQTYPQQTFRNLEKAIERNNLCVFATMDGERDKGEFTYWARRIAKVLFRAGPDDDLQFGTLTFTERETDGRELFYSAGEDYSVTVNGAEKKAVRPTPAHADVDVPENVGSTKWYRDLETGEYVMCYAVNRAIQGECARFPDADAVASDGAVHAPGYYEYDHTEDEYVVYTNDGEKKHYGTASQFEQYWETFTAPFIPEFEFPREPTEDDFVIVIIPDADSEKDQPHLYHHGETTPLFDELGVNTDALTLPDEESTVDPDVDPDPDSEAASDQDSGMEAVVLDRDNPPECPVCDDGTTMAAAALNAAGEVASTDRPDDTTHAGWLCRSCETTREPRPGVDDAPEHIVAKAEWGDVDTDTGSRLNPQVLAADPAVNADADTIAAIARGEQDPSADQQANLRIAIAARAPERRPFVDLTSIRDAISQTGAEAGSSDEEDMTEMAERNGDTEEEDEFIFGDARGEYHEQSSASDASDRPPALAEAKAVAGPEPRRTDEAPGLESPEVKDNEKPALAYTLTIAAERALRLAEHDPNSPVANIGTPQAAETATGPPGTTQPRATTTTENRARDIDDSDGEDNLDDYVRRFL